MKAGQDSATRLKLRNAAAKLFAHHGYTGVTIRDVCAAAGANIAAVNYHFDGKAGLYDEVVTAAMGHMQLTTEHARQAGTGRAAEERLRAYVRVLLTETSPHAPEAWAHHIMLRELTDPTPSLDRVLEGVVRPRMNDLHRIVAELLSCDAGDRRVARCAFSIHAQCLAMMNRFYVAQALDQTADSAVPVEALDVMVDHITEFSLAGLWALARTS